MKELKPILRNAEKLRERYSQRLLKYTKTLQDKRTRDRLYQSKAVSDSLILIHSQCDKMINLYMKDYIVYCKILKEKWMIGNQLFHGSEVSSFHLISPRSSPSLPLSLLSVSVPELSPFFSVFLSII